MDELTQIQTHLHNISNNLVIIVDRIRRLEDRTNEINELAQEAFISVHEQLDCINEVQDELTGKIHEIVRLNLPKGITDNVQ